MNELIIFAAKYLFLVSFVVTGLFFFTLEKSDKKKMFFLGLVSGVISFVLLKISAMVIQDPRPFVVNHMIPLIPHAADNGFPSDHALLTMWLATVVFSFNKRLGIILAIVSLMVGVSRVLALVHHPIDIVGSIAIAVVSVVVPNVVITKLMRQ